MLDEWWRAAVLGVIQALTEFLPISSSGHLVIAHEVLGEDETPLTFDVGLHTGTLAAILVYFWSDWYEILRRTVLDVRGHRHHLGAWSLQARLGTLIALATLPAVVVGLLFGDVIEDRLRAPEVVASLLIAGAIAMAVLDRHGQERGLGQVGVLHALVVGSAQALALVPGVSRSGATISAARGLGFARPDAARFSFLLAAPITLGAIVSELGGAYSAEEHVEWGPLLLGSLVAFAVGLLVIRFLLRFLATRTLASFVWYRIILGLGIFGALALGWQS